MNMGEDGGANHTLKRRASLTYNDLDANNKRTRYGDNVSASSSAVIRKAAPRKNKL